MSETSLQSIKKIRQILLELKNENKTKMIGASFIQRMK